MISHSNNYIIKNSQPLFFYPIEAIDCDVINLLNEAAKCIGTKTSENITRLLSIFECFCQITGTDITKKNLYDNTFSQICACFLGALNSENFMEGSFTSRYYFSRLFIDIYNSLQSILCLNVYISLPISSRHINKPICDYVSQFEKLKLKREKVWLWSGWKSTNRKGKTTYFPLYPLYKRLGREFCEDFSKICDEYFSGRNADKIDCLKSFTEYIGQYDKSLNPNCFKDRKFISTFWRDFYVYYVKTEHANGVGVVTLINQWKKSFIYFVETYLEGSGLFVKSWGALPSPSPNKNNGARTHIKNTSDGVEIKTKLITEIPLQITDEIAIKILFKQIQDDHDLFVNWARWSVNDIWQRYVRRRRLESIGTIRYNQNERLDHLNDKKTESLTWLTDRANPDCLKNAAASLKHYGFKTSKDCTLEVIFPTPLPQTALELALPVSGALLPHCILLVSQHPQITPSFLETLELFDKNGKLTGFIGTDAGFYLIGSKIRRGSELAEQKIHLNRMTKKIVQHIILLTKISRDYLKLKNDDNWRYLLLTVKSGFANPIRIRKLAPHTSDPIRVEEIAQSLVNTSDLSLAKRREYAQQFSLPSLRASAAVLVYLSSGSVHEMAKALGHKQYDSRLLGRYLPEPLQMVFNERWIRIFQEALIVEALKDSEFLLEASSFKNMAELDEFLKNHAFREIPKFLDDPYVNSDHHFHTEFTQNKEVVFGINTGILTILLSLKIAVNQSAKEVCAKAIYWSKVTEHLVAYLESNHNNRPDLKSYLFKAKNMANAQIADKFIYD